VSSWVGKSVCIIEWPGRKPALNIVAQKFISTIIECFKMQGDKFAARIYPLGRLRRRKTKRVLKFDARLSIKLQET
jgi:hypothetical protein